MDTMDHILQVLRRLGSGQIDNSTAAREVGDMAGETHLHFVDAVSAMTFEPLVTIEALGAVHGRTADRIAGDGFDDARGVAGQGRGNLGEIALQRDGAQLGTDGEN